MKTTIVTALQKAADAAVAAQKLPTHLVVVRPGTGEILAVSSNAAADPWQRARPATSRPARR